LRSCWPAARRQAAPTAAPEQPFKITVQLDWVAEPEHGGFYQAEAKGYFKDAGLDVVLTRAGRTPS
jgi:NitT/TauT family transport system substrate-binding protein